jgi:hypothetical protein
MTTFARIVAVAVGASIFAGLVWLIREKLAPPPIAADILFILSLFFSIIAGALFGEHFLNFLKRRDKNTWRDR